MINRTAIQQWSEYAPWIDNAQIEQDLIICRALVSIFSDDSIFSDEFLASQLAFRGGTALHKLYLSPQPRYSEDIDLVQITPGPIKPIMYRLGEVLDWLPDRVTKQKRYNNTMLFRVESEIPPTVQIRLKVEINCFEWVDKDSVQSGELMVHWRSRTNNLSFRGIVGHQTSCPLPAQERTRPL